MLVLSRKPIEEILIGDNINITVLKVKGNTVRIGIEAPAAVKVKRGELPSERPAPREVELTLSFSPAQEGVAADKESSAERQAPQVIKFESTSSQRRRPIPQRDRKSIPTNTVVSGTLSVDDESGERAHGTNRIREILSRIASGLPADDLTND